MEEMQVQLSMMLQLWPLLMTMFFSFFNREALEAVILDYEKKNNTKQNYKMNKDLYFSLYQKVQEAVSQGVLVLKTMCSSW